MASRRNIISCGRDDDLAGGGRDTASSRVIKSRARRRAFGWRLSSRPDTMTPIILKMLLTSATALHTSSFVPRSSAPVASIQGKSPKVALRALRDRIMDGPARWKARFYAVWDEDDGDDLSALPSGWKEFIDPASGQKYYGSIQGDTQWRRPKSNPPGLSLPEVEPQPAPLVVPQPTVVAEELPTAMPDPRSAQQLGKPSGLAEAFRRDREQKKSSS